MKGFVPTPSRLVDAMVEKLFHARPPQDGDTLLDPGCGTGAFIHGILRWCRQRSHPVPRIIGIDSDQVLLNQARRDLGEFDAVALFHNDFLTGQVATFDYIIGNPPYVPITGLTVEERTAYRQRYQTARGRFDLYLLFFERALSALKPKGRLVFVTPEKYLYVQTAEPLRRALAQLTIEEIELIDESSFGTLVTYPTITTIVGEPGSGDTRIKLRDGTARTIRPTSVSPSWLPLMEGLTATSNGPVLADAFVRISCGVATGADEVYVMDSRDVTASLKRFAFPTLSGRRIARGGDIEVTQSMLIPYAETGALLPESELGPLEEYLRDPTRHERLMRRTCVLRKPWYAFHENPPLPDILRPKILCKDITAKPWFVVDERGKVVPRHSVYYLVPKQQLNIQDLCDYLNSSEASEWLMAHCQRAANGFVRLQSHVLKRMPLPERFAHAAN